jgi:hypothetical protein
MNVPQLWQKWQMMMAHTCGQHPIAISMQSAGIDAPSAGAADGPQASRPTPAAHLLARQQLAPGDAGRLGLAGGVGEDVALLRGRQLCILCAAGDGVVFSDQAA